MIPGRTDLVDYIDGEFGGSGRSISADWTPSPMIPFWGEFLRSGDLPRLDG